MNRSSLPAFAVGITIALSVMGLLCSSALGDVSIEIRLGKNDRVNTPVRVELPAAATAKRYRVGRAIVERVMVDGKPCLHLLISGKAGDVVKLTATPVSKLDTRDFMQCIVDEKHIALKAGDRSVLQYNRAVVASPKGAKPTHARSGFIHPVLTPSGRTVTNAFPPNHWHHYGLWSPWRKTEFEGQEVNFWETGAGQGTVRFKKLIGHGGDQYSTWFNVEHEHVALKVKGGPKVVLNETWHVRAYATPKFNLFDIDTNQTAASNSPLRILKYYYGGFGMRGSGQWEGQAMDFLTSEGKTRKDGNFTAARWVSMSGQLDGKPAGITIMGHPGNFRAPQKTRLHPKEPFFCFVPGMDKPFEIKPDHPYAARYRFAVHDGKIDPKLMERLWHDYAEPPIVVVVP